MKRILATLLLICMAMPVHAASTASATGKVTSIKTFASNYNPYSENYPVAAYIYVDTLPGACGQADTRFAIRTTHPGYETVLSLATTALATGKSVSVTYIQECTIRGNAWDFAYMTLNSN